MLMFCLISITDFGKPYTHLLSLSPSNDFNIMPLGRVHRRCAVTACLSTRLSQLSVVSK